MCLPFGFSFCAQSACLLFEKWLETISELKKNCLKFSQKFEKVQKIKTSIKSLAKLSKSEGGVLCVCCVWSCYVCVRVVCVCVCACVRVCECTKCKIRTFFPTNDIRTSSGEGVKINLWRIEPFLVCLFRALKRHIWGMSGSHEVKQSKVQIRSWWPQKIWIWCRICESQKGNMTSTTRARRLGGKASNFSQSLATSSLPCPATTLVLRWRVSFRRYTGSQSELTACPWPWSALLHVVCQ